MGVEYFYAHAQMRAQARGRPNGPVVDSQVIDGDWHE